MTSAPVMGTGEYVPYSPGVRAGVAGADALEVLCRRERERTRAVDDREHGELGTGEPLLDHDPAAGVTERRARRYSPMVSRASARDVLTSTPLPAARPSVFTTNRSSSVSRNASAG